MANAFDALAARMDSVTQQRFGKPITINGNDVVAVEAHFLPEMGALIGDGLSVVVFSDAYKPRKNDAVSYLGKPYIVTRNQLFNGKPHIWLE